MRKAASSLLLTLQPSPAGRGCDPTLHLSIPSRPYASYLIVHRLAECGGDELHRLVERVQCGEGRATAAEGGFVVKEGESIAARCLVGAHGCTRVHTGGSA